MPRNCATARLKVMDQIKKILKQLCNEIDIELLTMSRYPHLITVQRMYDSNVVWTDKFESKCLHCN